MWALMVHLLCMSSAGHAYQAGPSCQFYNYYIYHSDTLDQRESVLDKSHITHLRVRYKKYCTLILIKTFQDIITSLMIYHISLMTLKNAVQTSVEGVMLC